MSLPAPPLDTRRFQDIVDEAKSAIPLYCPEWTDHNVSDPGVALIELFAWMTDLLLYRVNQVPDRMYVKFLELMGIRLDPPRPARAPVTFYLSAPQPIDLVVPEGTEVATIRTDTSPAIVFTTESDLAVRTVNLQQVLTRAVTEDAWVSHDVRKLDYLTQTLPIFASQARPAAGDALYLGLERDHSQHVLAVRMTLDLAAGGGPDPTDAPRAWEAWQGPDAGWVACAIEHDGTHALNKSGEVILHAPPMAERDLEGTTGYWLRCILKEARPGQRTYFAAPMLRQLHVEARGGTVVARHAITVSDEILGHSDGKPGQTFKLLNTPLLARDPHRDHLVVEAPGSPDEIWTEVSDFADSGEHDRHYTLDSMTGDLTFGPALLQPDGKMYCFGEVPSKGSRLRMARYQHGGGVIGNASAGALSMLKSSIPYVARVSNRQRATGGLNAQSLEHAKLKAPQELRSRARAVTSDDYEYIASKVDGVARAYCLSAGSQPRGDDAPPPGHIEVLVLPRVEKPHARLDPDRIVPTPDLLENVQRKLDEQRLLGTTLAVRAPALVWVSVGVTLRVPPRTDAALMDDVRLQAEAALYRYLNPYTGGPRNDGWPLGRDLNRSELFGLLQQLPLVEYADRLSITAGPTDHVAPQGSAQQPVIVPFDGVVCSGEHQVKVEFVHDEG